MATILVVDDSPTQRHELVRLLRSQGHHLLEASTGAEGLQLLAAGRSAWANTASPLPAQQDWCSGEALPQSEERYRSLVEGSIQGIAIRQDSRLCYANPALARIFGYASPDELVGRSWETLVAPENQALLQSRAEACLRGEVVPIHPGWQGVRRDGSRIWVQSTLSLISWQNRPALGVCVLDVTELRRLEEHFLQSQKMEAIARLAGGVAHDFNNLLTVITGYSQILQSRLHHADPLCDIIGEIQKASDQAASLTRQLLTFSRSQVLMPVVVDLNVLIRDMEKMLQRLIGEEIDLRISLEPDLWLTRVDPGRIEQALMNLIMNARDAMPRGGKLAIDTQNLEIAVGSGQWPVVSEAATGCSSLATGHWPLATVPAGQFVRLTVQDTGLGMDDVVKARLFEPFFTTKPPQKGTGFGLATVYGIVKQSNGHIEVQSEPGQGTTFRIYLPRHEGSLPTKPAGWGPSQVRRGVETVLLVEDEDPVRALVRLVLQEQGYTVLEARHGGEAMRLCQRHQGVIDILVTDVVMPHMNGPELARDLAVLCPLLKVLYLSGYTDETILDPETPFLQKPFAPDVLARKVRELLDS